MKKTVKKKAGRKTKEFIFQENKELILQLARTGSTNKEICDVLGLGETPFYAYLNRDETFKDELARAKVKADTKVENALYKRATGYDIIEEQTDVEPTGKEGSKVLVKKVRRTKKHVPGDTTAMIFWLKNRKAMQWRDKQEVEHSGAVDVNKVTTVKLTKVIKKDN